MHSAFCGGNHKNKKPVIIDSGYYQLTNFKEREIRMKNVNVVILFFLFGISAVVMAQTQAECLYDASRNYDACCAPWLTEPTPLQPPTQPNNECGMQPEGDLTEWNKCITAYNNAVAAYYVDLATYPQRLKNWQDTVLVPWHANKDAELAACNATAQAAQAYCATLE